MAEVILKLESVAKNYVGALVTTPVLRDVNMSVDSNDYIALVGPSGSGKTTLMNLMGCLDKPSEGEVTVKGNAVSGLNDRRMSRLRNTTIGFVFQNYSLLPKLTTLENVVQPLIFSGYPRGKRRQRALECLEKVSLSHRTGYYPNQLSGGQQQRVAVARALVNDPEIILADEPTGNLDLESGAEILKLFDHAHEQGHCVIIVTHDQDVAASCQRLCRVVDGRVVCDE